MKTLSMNVVPSWQKTEDLNIFIQRFLSVLSVTSVIQTSRKDQNEGVPWTCPHELVHSYPVLTVWT